ncbi:HAD family hydrolase, partial [archaeon]
PFLLPGILCNDSTIHIAAAAAPEGDLEQANPPSPSYDVKGDPTETCIISLAAQQHHDPTNIKRLQQQYVRLAEVPFDSAHKFMATLHCLPARLLHPAPDLAPTSPSLPAPSADPKVVLMKGSPERVLRFCVLAEAQQARWLRRAEELAGEGMRVLALAYREMWEMQTEEILVLPNLMDTCTQGGFTIHALLGILDPPRAEAIVAVQQAQSAGITVKMITGDHPSTALAIAKQLGMKCSR